MTVVAVAVAGAAPVAVAATARAVLSRRLATATAATGKAVLYYPNSSIPLAPEKPLRQAPYKVHLAADEEKFWCACGYSSKQPWCDGSHRKKLVELRMSGVKVKNDHVLLAPGDYYICGCKKSKRAPFCDGTHETCK